MEKKSIELKISDIMVSETEAEMKIKILSEEKDTIKLTGLMYAMMETMKKTYQDYLGLGEKVNTSELEVIALRWLREIITKVELHEEHKEEVPKKIGGGKPGRKWTEEAKQRLRDKNMKLKLITQMGSKESAERTKK